MNYSQAVLYLNSFINYEKSCNFTKINFKLKRFVSFLETIGNPHKDLKVIHVAGTKGKGSVCVFISYILKNAGFKTGLYTSPHLSSFRERIRIVLPQRKTSVFEGAISKKEIVKFTSKLKPLIEKFNQASNLGKLTFFEVYTALCFCYFKEKKVDYVVLEAGLGGRLDATNVVREKIACITPLSLEHTQILGNSLAKIASEKLGIIREKGTTLIISPQEKEAQAQVEKKEKQFQLNLVKLNKNQIKEKTFNFKSQKFDLKTNKNNYKGLEIKLLGRYQLVNAALAVLVAENLGIIKRKTIYNGLKEAFWPARFEILETNPYIVIDGAQNGASFESLNDAVEQYFRDYKKILILGICNDKDIEGISQKLEIYDEIILSQSQNPRALSPEIMRDFINRKTRISTNIKNAIEISRPLINKKTVIIIAGSLFLSAEARNISKREKCLIE